MFQSMRIMVYFCIAIMVMMGRSAADDVAAFFEGKQFVVGFAQDTMANDWRVAQVRALQAGLAPYPSIRFVHTDGGGQVAKQSLDIERLVAQGIDVLVASPSDAAALTPVIAKVYASGIPVVLLSRGINSDDYTTFITGDNRQIAQQAAAFMAENLTAGGNVLMLQGIPTSSTAIARTEGFVDEAAKHSNLNVVAIKPANYLRGDAALAVEEAVSEGLSFNAIYAQSDSMASGARMALEALNIDHSKVFTVGIDYITEAHDAIKAGSQDASFTYVTFGKEGAEAVINILRGDSVPKKVVVTSVPVTRDNVDSIPPIF